MVISPEGHGAPTLHCEGQMAEPHQLKRLGKACRRADENRAAVLRDESHALWVKLGGAFKCFGTKGIVFKNYVSRLFKKYYGYTIIDPKNRAPEA